MDAGFLNFHGEEHFSTLDSSYFLDAAVGSDTGSYYEHGYTWDWENERELNGDIGLIPVSGNTDNDYCIMSTSPPSKEDFQKIMMEWQQLVNIETENAEELAIDVVSSNAVDTAQPENITDDTENRNILDFSETNPYEKKINGHRKELILPFVKDSVSDDASSIHDNSTIIDTNNSSMEDLYNNMDPISHLANSDFDITKYVNEIDKYCRNPETILPSGPGPGGKKLDLKNQRYVIDSHSDSENDHIDIETVSETNTFADDDVEEERKLNANTLFELGNILAIKTERNDNTNEDAENVNSKVTIKTELEDHGPEEDIVYSKIDGESNVSVGNFYINQEIKNEKDNSFDLSVSYDIIEDSKKNTSMNVNNMKDLNVKNANLEIDKKHVQGINNKNGLDKSNNKRDLVTNIINVKLEKKTENIIGSTISPAIEAGDLNSLLEQFEATETNNSSEIKEEIILDNNLVKKEVTESNRKDPVKSKQILESLPEELINRIKQSSKRKSISVIPPIPTKKRGKLMQGISVNNSSEAVQMDHDYCVSSNSSKKDSGFSSCEEDERFILRNQPTIKTADGKLMVSLLKVNTIRKRKLNLEEYKQRRQGRSCSGSPARTEDENARRLQRMNIQPCAPPNMEVKTIVSVGVNTDQSWGRLQEIVRGCRVNFSPNSLITSLVEHLPQIKETHNYGGEHGEDKTIVYSDKNRVPVKTLNKGTQTITHRRSSSSSSSCSSRSSRSRTRSPSPCASHRRTNSEKVREVEERRVIYVGKISNSVTRECLRKRFQRFGPINNISVHSRRTGDNYGFVTFKYKEDAYKAVEYGNEDPNLPQYDLSFGGRRIFCQASYSDLDNLHDDCVYPVSKANHEGSFDELLREAQAKLLRNKGLNGKS